MRVPEKWESKWKRFLYEGMSPQTIKANELEKVFATFHISEKKLSTDETFVFNPRLPRHPYQDHEGNVTEDDFTPRISISPSIELALKAIEGQYGKENWLHLYASFDPPDGEAKQEDCPETDSMPYDTNFILSKWLEDKLNKGEIKPPASKTLEKWLDDKSRNRGTISPSGLPKYLKQEFEFCVPDADETRESWLLKPTTMIHVGELNAETGEIILSNAGLYFVKKAGLETEDY